MNMIRDLEESDENDTEAHKSELIVEMPEKSEENKIEVHKLELMDKTKDPEKSEENNKEANKSKLKEAMDKIINLEKCKENYRKAQNTEMDAAMDKIRNMEKHEENDTVTHKSKLKAVMDKIRNLEKSAENETAAHKTELKATADKIRDLEESKENYTEAHKSKLKAALDKIRDPEKSEENDTEAQNPELKAAMDKIRNMEKSEENDTDEHNSELKAAMDKIRHLKKSAENETETHKSELKAAMDKIKDLEDKYSILTSKLRDKIECPVCYEVPTTWPVPVCPNGHVICTVCRQTQCPICRCSMLDGTSLLAKTFIENIEHRCPIIGCQALLYLDQLDGHQTVCPHRLVHCPAPVGKCNKMVKFSDLLSHVTEECHRSNKHGVKKFENKNTWTFSSCNGFAKLTRVFICHGETFFLTSDATEAGGLTVGVQMLGTEAECSSLGVDITIHRVDDPGMVGKHLQKFVGDVCSVDMNKTDRTEYGFVLGKKALSRIVSRESKRLKYSITVCLDRYT